MLHTRLAAMAGRLRRRPIVLYVLVAVAIGASLLLACELAGWPFLREPLRAAVSRSCQAPVRIEGAFRLHLLINPRLAVDKLTIGTGAAFEHQPLLDVQGGLLRWSWFDGLWRWQRGGRTAALPLRELRAKSLQLNLLRLADGSSSWSGCETTTAWPRIEQLAVDEASLHIVDVMRDMQLDVHIGSSPGSSSGSDDRTYTAIAKGRHGQRPIDIAARSVGLPVLGDSDAATTGGRPLHIEGTVGQTHVAFDGHASVLLSAAPLAGQLELRATSLAAVGDALGLSLPSTPPFTLEGQLRHAGERWQLQAVRATVGKSRLGGDFDFDSAVTPPKLSGWLTGESLHLADLGPAIGAVPGAAAESRCILPLREFDLPSLSAMDADLQIAIDKLDFGTDALRQMHDLRGHLVLADGVLRLPELQASADGGRVSGSSSLDASGTNARWGANLALEDIEVSQWIKGLQRQDGDKQPYLSGKLAGNVRVHGTGRSTAGILGTLDGEVHLQLRQAQVSHLATEIAGLDVAETLGVAVTGDEPLRLNCARLDAKVKNGVLTPTLAILDNSDSTLRLSGKVDLRDETLALRSVVHPKDISALSLRTPLLITGTLSDPKLTLEAKPLALRALAAVGLALVKPLAAVLSFADPGAGEPDEPCALRGAAAASAAAR